MICNKPDITVVSGCALANVPLLLISNNEFEELKNGQEIDLNTDSTLNPINFL